MNGDQQHEPLALKARIRFKIGTVIIAGPGKIQLLEAIERSGSISAAARELAMSYKRAWSLIDTMNHHFDLPVVQSNFGGKAGGQSSLTEFGRELCRRYRRIEQALRVAGADDIAWMEGHARAAENLPADGKAAP